MSERQLLKPAVTSAAFRGLIFRQHNRIDRCGGKRLFDGLRVFRIGLAQRSCVPVRVHSGAGLLPSISRSVLLDPFKNLNGEIGTEIWELDCVAPFPLGKTDSAFMKETSG